MIAFVPEKYASKQSRNIKVKPVSISGFIFGKEWFPSTQPASQTGVLPLLIGTFMVSLLAILFALPFGLATAIYLSEIASKRVRAILKPIIELLAGIPSVVYGFFGLVVIVPIIQKTFDLAVGETALAGAIILAIMALPTIISISEDALRSTPRSLREASLSLGATQWQTIYRVVVPYASSGITAAIMLGVGRAIGETMAVIMVTGNAAVIPHTVLEPVRTIPATIAAELGEAPQGGIHYEALFALGAILFLFTLIINTTVQFISKRRQKN
jgi:phosphate transport system permease protein